MNLDKLLTKDAWKAVAERALSTGIQTAIPAIAVGGLTTIAWAPLASVVGSAVLLSVLKNVLAILTTGTPSIGDAEVPADRVVAQTTNSGLVVAGEATAPDADGNDIPAGTPVVVDDATPATTEYTEGEIEFPEDAVEEDPEDAEDTETR